MNVIYDGQVAIGGFQDSAFLVRNHLAHFEIIHRPAVQFQRQPFGDDSQCGKIAGFDVAPICRMVRQQLDGVAVLRRVQRRREGFVCTAPSVPSAFVTEAALTTALLTVSFTVSDRFSS